MPLEVIYVVRHGVSLIKHLTHPAYTDSTTPVPYSLVGRPDHGCLLIQRPLTHRNRRRPATDLPRHPPSRRTRPAPSDPHTSHRRGLLKPLLPLSPNHHTLRQPQRPQHPHPPRTRNSRVLRRGALQPPRTRQQQRPQGHVPSL